jgi:hypothetical protein
LLSGTVSAGDDLAAFQAQVAKRLKGDYQGYATPYTGIYSLSLPSEKESKTPIMADQELTMLANSFTEAWSYFKAGNPPVEAAKVHAIRQRAAAELHFESAIVFRQGNAPISIAVYSAVDCGYCRRLEAFLSNHKIAYAAFPGSLYRENFSLAKGVWCSEDRAKAWQAVMQHDVDLARVENCPAYPLADIRYTGALFSYGNTPGIIFADGDVIARLPVGKDEEAEFLAIVRDKIAKQIVFNIPE